MGHSHGAPFGADLLPRVRTKILAQMMVVPLEHISEPIEEHISERIKERTRCVAARHDTGY